MCELLLLKKQEIELFFSVNFKRNKYALNNLQMFELMQNDTKINESMSNGKSTLNVNEIL